MGKEYFSLVKRRKGTVLGDRKMFHDSPNCGTPCTHVKVREIVESAKLSTCENIGKRGGTESMTRHIMKKLRIGPWLAQGQPFS